MKPILKTTFYIAVFAIAGVLFQISCSNSDASIPALNTGKLVYLKQTTGLPIELWQCDYDGTNQGQIAVSLPANVDFSAVNSNRSSVKISPDGQKIFFIGFNNATGISTIYSCDFSGANLQEVVNSTTTSYFELGGLN